MGKINRLEKNLELSYWENYKKKRREDFIDMIKHPKKLIIGALIYAALSGTFYIGLTALNKTKMIKQYNEAVKEIYFNKN